MPAKRERPFNFYFAIFYPQRMRMHAAFTEIGDKRPTPSDPI
jgi:hypothetical protein